MWPCRGAGMASEPTSSSPGPSLLAPAAAQRSWTRASMSLVCITSGRSSKIANAASIPYAPQFEIAAATRRSVGTVGTTVPPHGQVHLAPYGTTRRTVSNWGAYGIEAALAILLERPEVMHTSDIDARVHDLCAAAGANNDGPGLLDVGSDAIPAPLHGHIVDLLGQMVRSGMDFGRLYREPRYPWL